MRITRAAAVFLFTASTLIGAEDSPIVLADFEQVLESDGSFVLPTRDGFAYSGLEWYGIYIVDADHSLTDRIPNSGYRTGRVSGRYVAVAGNRGVAHSVIRSIGSERFDLRSVNLTAAWRNGLQVRIEAKRGDEIAGVREVELDTVRPLSIETDFADVDAVLISANGGEDAGVCQSAVCRGGPEVVIDDLRFTIRSPMVLSEAVEETVLEPEAEVVEQTQAQLDPPEPDNNQLAASPPAARQGPPVEQASIKQNKVLEPSRLGGESCAETTYYGVQVGAFRQRDNAANLAARLREAHGAAQVHAKDVEKGQLYFVIAGCFKNQPAASALSAELRSAGQEGITVRASASRFGPQLPR